MAKPNPLQEQLLKAGLVKKSKLAEVAREQQKARHAKGPAAPDEIALAAEQARAAKAERDRTLAAMNRIASGYASHSAVYTLDASVSAVSPSSTGTVFCRIIGPVS